MTRPGRRLLSIGALLLFAMLSGCKPTASVASIPTPRPVSSPSAAPSAPPRYALSDWTRDILSTYAESSVRDEGDGLITSAACFEKVSGKCTIFTFAKHDGFRKARFFEPSGAVLAEYGEEPILATRVVLLDCDRPLIALRASFRSKRGWLFLRQVAVMLDGGVVIERRWEHFEVQRDSESYGVEERANAIATEDEIAALRKVASAKAVLVRLTGDKGFVPLTAKGVERFRGDAQVALAVYDRLMAALANAPKATCS